MMTDGSNDPLISDDLCTSDDLCINYDPRVTCLHISDDLRTSIVTMDQ